jgi:hypothetical protein
MPASSAIARNCQAFGASVASASMNNNSVPVHKKGVGNGSDAEPRNAVTLLRAVLGSFLRKAEADRDKIKKALTVL